MPAACGCINTQKKQLILPASPLWYAHQHNVPRMPSPLTYSSLHSASEGGSSCSCCCCSSRARRAAAAAARCCCCRCLGCCCHHHQPWLLPTPSMDAREASAGSAWLAAPPAPQPAAAPCSCMASRCKAASEIFPSSSRLSRTLLGTVLRVPLYGLRWPACESDKRSQQTPVAVFASCCLCGSSRSPACEGS